MYKPTELIGEEGLDLKFNLSVTTSNIYDDAEVPLSLDFLAFLTSEEIATALEWERSIMFWTTMLNNFQTGRKLFYHTLGEEITKRKAAQTKPE